MEIIVTEYEDHTELDVREHGINLHVFTFDDKKAHMAFIQGMNCMKNLCNRAVQSISIEYKKNKV